MGCRVGFSGVMLASSPQYCRDWFTDGGAPCNFAYFAGYVMDSPQKTADIGLKSS